MKRPHVLAAAVVSAAALAWYVAHLCPSLCVFGDSATFTAAAVSGGVAQPSGYPLWTMLGYVASLAPLGDPAWRVNFTSALYHALAVGVVALVALRRWGMIAGAVGGAAYLAFSRSFLHGSLYAEVFPLNDLFTAVLIGFAWELARETDDARARRLLLAMAVVVGLASAHHQSIVLLAPCLAVLVWAPCVRIFRKSPKLLGSCVGLWLIPALLSYGGILLATRRDPWLSWGDAHDAGALWRLFTRADYGGVFSAALGAKGDGAWSRIGQHLGATQEAFGVLGIALAGAGLFWLWRTERKAAIALLLGWLAAGPAFSAMNTIPSGSASEAAFLGRFDTMAHTVLGLILCAGVAWLAEALSSRLAPALVRLLAGGVWVVPLAFGLSVDLSEDRLGPALSRDLVASSDDGSLVLVSGDATLGPTAFQCAALRACGSRIVMSPGQLHLAWRASQVQRRHPELVVPPPAGAFVTTRELIAANLGRRPIYLVPTILDREPALREGLEYIPQGLLLRVMPSHEQVDAARSAFLRRSEELAIGRGLEGLSAIAALPAVDPLEQQAVSFYGTALENHSRIAGLVFEEQHLGSELHARAEAIFARAR